MRNQGHKWTLKTNDANQANTYLRSNYPEEVVTRRHRVRASQGCHARIVELDQRSQFKAEKTQARKPEQQRNSEGRSTPKPTGVRGAAHGQSPRTRNIKSQFNCAAGAADYAAWSIGTVDSITGKVMIFDFENME